jgi:cytochrome c peroxidase
MRALIIPALVFGLVAATVGAKPVVARDWSSEDLKRIQSLSLASLPALPADPSNRVADNKDAALLGKALFLDPGMSANGAVACASCHRPERQFQDDLPAARGVAPGTTRTMPLVGSAYMPFLFWDGRKDSQWSQALGPIENPLEHGADRVMAVRHVAKQYAAQYTALFGPLPDLTGLPLHGSPAGTTENVRAWAKIETPRQVELNRAFANIGKAIAAFERTLRPAPTRFDAYAAALAKKDRSAAARALTPREENGLKLFIGEANCLNCHNGPLLTDNAFHNIGLQKPSEAGRSAAVFNLLADPFNCLGPFSDAKSEDCGELNFIETDSHDLVGAFRSPSLRGVSTRPPYTHAATMKTIRDVLDHYNKAPKAKHGHSELRALGLTANQLAELEAFLTTLNDAP